MKTQTEISEFIRLNRANPYFWLSALKTASYISDNERRDHVIETCHEKLKAFIDFVYAPNDERRPLFVENVVEIENADH